MPTQIPFLPIVAPDAGPQVIRMAVTKAMATEWLKLNTINRNPSSSRIKQLAAMMNNGEWNDNLPSPVAFSADCLLLDGQHRLMALAESTISEPLAMWVSFNLPRETREIIDCGWTRRLDQRMGGSKDEAAIVQWLNNVETGRRAPATPNKYKDLLAKHSAGIAWVADWPSTVGFCRTQLKCAVMMLWQSDRAKGEEFRKILLDPDEAAVGHPAYTLRKKVLEWLTTRKMPSQLDMYRYALAATTAALEGRTLTKLYMKDIKRDDR